MLVDPNKVSGAFDSDKGLFPSFASINKQILAN